MKFFVDWLKALFRVEVTWVDKGQGKWVKQRRYHPLTRFVVIVTVLVLAISWSLNFFYSEEKPVPGTEPGERESGPRYPEPRIREPRMTDFMPGSADVVVPVEPLPGPIPSDLHVAADEYWIRIDKSDYRLYLYQGDEVDRIFKVAVGRNAGDKQRRGDNRTPTGIFSVQSIENSSAWTHDFRDGKGVIRGAYGPWFIRLKTGWQGIGIHGTHAPDSIGSMVSEGCIRMQNKDLEELKHYAFKDMKVVIEE